MAASRAADRHGGSRMVDLGVMAIVIWVGSFAVVSIDSAMRRTSSWFWRAASLFGGPFALIAYGTVRELPGKK